MPPVQHYLRTTLVPTKLVALGLFINMMQPLRLNLMKMNVIYLFSFQLRPLGCSPSALIARDIHKFLSQSSFQDVPASAARIVFSCSSIQTAILFTGTLGQMEKHHVTVCF
jgi:hypothetical protein